MFLKGTGLVAKGSEPLMFLEPFVETNNQSQEEIPNVGKYLVRVWSMFDKVILISYLCLIN